MSGHPSVVINTSSGLGELPLSRTEQEANRWEASVAAAHEWEHHHEAEWVRVDQKLRRLAARRGALDAEEARLLRYAEELKLWRGFACGSLLEYMERAMGYAPHTASERIRVARALGELPLLGDALERGELSHSAVRELSRVAVPDTEAIWIEAAAGKCLREIEAMVSGHRPGDLPTDKTEPRLHRRKITLEVSPETYDIWRWLHVLAAEEHGQRLSDDELIQSLFRRAYGVQAGGDRVDVARPDAARTDVEGAAAQNAAAQDAAAQGAAAQGAAARGANIGSSATRSANASTAFSSPAYKIAIKRCPDCNRAWQFSGGRDIEIDPAVLECAECDAVYLGSLDTAVPERATTTVTPRKREHVLARDGNHCTVPGCRRSVGLDLHHIEYQSRGGGHELGNLTTICDLHHRAVHDGKLVIRGNAPERLVFEFRKPRDRRNVTDDDAAAPRPGRASPTALPYPAHTTAKGSAPTGPLYPDHATAEGAAPAGPL
jgi:hypothetical protein